MKENAGKGKFWFILPALLIYLFVIVVPSIYSLFISFYNWDGVGKMKFVGFDNYVYLFLKDNVFQISLKNNIIWTILTVVFTVSIALLIAVALNREFKGRVAYRGIIYFPYTLSGVVVALIWTWMYHPQLGLINGLLEVLGLHGLTKAWLSDPQIALYAVYVAALWQGLGAPMVLFLSGLQTISKDYLEAALIDGAGKFRTFFSIIIPLLRETFVIVFATQIINSLKVYDIISVMTNGGPGNSTQVLATWMYQQSFMFSKLGIGSAIAWVMVVVLMIVIIPYVLYMARD
ncbi:carbohydrate ABC transporter permease [Mahella australiensis]|uniref:Binding-protein-dependent transport systems inner membrane component n=1 Tax=Mahella australiensis (strain DSM 15567 / CIP 107919 / 50-1 BON) TaxID=697281 RepID=F3ZY38_MAHA5|nr:sugar ABC transporter permease [Mahella australiensis]AEE97734.1 binding-protein-dependent transport systems inner membrane component [Mahella australiensis 50-1 BON]